MTTAKESQNPNSAVSPPQSPPQKKQRNPKTLREIPEEIIFYEILPRIPAKILTTFKLVSHQWNSFISYPNTLFANTHLHLSARNSRSVLTIDSLFFQSVEYEKVVGSSLEITKYGTHLANRVPLWLLSSCNGLGFSISYGKELKLKCICEDKHKCECRRDISQFHPPDDLHEFEFRYLICNPVLGIDSFVEIDHPHDLIDLGNSYKPRKNCYNFGFGYVSSLDDYNIVVIILPRGVVPSKVVVYVYSLRSLRWQKPRIFKEDKFPLEFQNVWYNEIGTLVNETLHWGIKDSENHNCIAAFDLATQDEFMFVPLPYARERLVNLLFRLCCMDGCLCVWTNYVGDDDHDDNGWIGHLVEMWMMKKYGDYYSFTKLFRCDLGYCPCKFFGFTKAGMVLIHVFDDNKLRLIDVNCDPPRVMGIEVEDIWEAVNYVPSLVSPLAIMSEHQAKKNR